MRANKPYLKTISFALGSFILVLGLLLFPDSSFTAALRGLKLWWDVVFPALLPFFITSEILLGLGLAHFMGVLLEPFMRPIFNISGYGSFVWAIGFASGYPISAKLTCHLREQNLVTRVEGERLVSFTTSSDPVFITGAIAVGFFKNAKIGLLLLIIHFLSAIIVGLFMARYKPKAPHTPPPGQRSRRPLFIRALASMHNARLQDGRQIGKLMGDAVGTSIQTQMVIGGFILLFSVILSILDRFHIIALISEILGKILTFFGQPPEASLAFVYGFFEVTLGAKQASDYFTSDSTTFILAVTGTVLAWGGISVHAQIASILAESDIRYFPFLMARILHGILAFLLTYLIAPRFLSNFSGNTITVWLSRQAPQHLSWWSNALFQNLTLFVCGGILLITGWLLYLGKRIKE